MKRKTLHLRDAQKSKRRERPRGDKQSRGLDKAKWLRVMRTTGVTIVTNLIRAGLLKSYLGGNHSQSCAWRVKGHRPLWTVTSADCITEPQRLLTSDCLGSVRLLDAHDCLAD